MLKNNKSLYKKIKEFVFLFFNIKKKIVLWFSLVSQESEIIELCCHWATLTYIDDENKNMFSYKTPKSFALIYLSDLNLL